MIRPISSLVLCIAIVSFLLAGCTSSGMDVITLKGTASPNSSGSPAPAVSATPIDMVHVSVDNPAPAETKNLASGITSEQLAMHSSENDCWIVYEGRVYDFTDAPMHPNMAKTFFRHCGQQAGFEEAAKARHSGSSEGRVANYGTYVGDLIG